MLEKRSGDVFPEVPAPFPYEREVDVPETLDAVSIDAGYSSWHRIDENGMFPPLKSERTLRQGVVVAVVASASSQYEHSLQQEYVSSESHGLYRCGIGRLGYGGLMCLPAGMFSPDGDPWPRFSRAFIDFSECDVIYDATGKVFDGKKRQRAAYLPGELVYDWEQGHYWGHPVLKATSDTTVAKKAFIVKRLMDARAVMFSHIGGFTNFCRQGEFTDIVEMLSAGKLLLPEFASYEGCWKYTLVDTEVRKFDPKLKIAVTDGFYETGDDALNRISNAIDMLDGLFRIWDTVTGGCFQLNRPLESGNEHPIPQALKMAEIANAIGAMPMIEAYLSGIPLEDIIA